MEVKLTTQNFDETIKTDKPVLIDFWATWCGPCRMIAPEVAAVAKERADVLVCKANVDEEPALAMKYNVNAIPTLVVLKDGKQMARHEGFCKKSQLLALLDGAKK